VRCKCVSGSEQKIPEFLPLDFSEDLKASAFLERDLSSFPFDSTDGFKRGMGLLLTDPASNLHCYIQT